MQHTSEPTIVHDQAPVLRQQQLVGLGEAVGHTLVAQLQEEPPCSFAGDGRIADWPDRRVGLGERGERACRVEVQGVRRKIAPLYMINMIYLKKCL